MPHLLETRMFRLHWGNAHSAQSKTKTGESGIVQPSEPALEDRMAQVLAEITDGNWEIKASLPLTASEFATIAAQPVKNGTVFGTSYAAPFTDGVVLLCQRQRSVDEESFATIHAEREERQSRIRSARRDVFLKEHPVSEKRKLIGGRTYVFRGVDYATREEAEAAQALALAML
jgi:hypothetical protein